MDNPYKYPKNKDLDNKDRDSFNMFHNVLMLLNIYRYSIRFFAHIFNSYPTALLLPMRVHIFFS
jgi:hypothetical protein